jgi:hypothetical protein
MTDKATAMPDLNITHIKKTRTTTRKIGKCTFTVYSSFKGGKERDIVSTIARLIQNDTVTKPGA